MSDPLDEWQRHDLLHVQPSAWPGIVGLPPHLTALPHVARWAARGWPVIVRRRAKEDAPDMIPAGFPLPPDCGKLRIPVQLAPEDVIDRVPPLTLRAAREATPSSWHATVDALLSVADRAGIEPLVYGSVLWQRLTRLPYLSAASDLDLIWPVGEAVQAMELARQLVTLERVSQVHFDGELLLPSGEAVQWREFYHSPTEVLVKTSGDVRLLPVAALFPARALAA